MGRYQGQRVRVPSKRRVPGLIRDGLRLCAKKHCDNKLGAYATSEAAVNAPGRVMVMELAGDKIRVNTICPGFSRTIALGYGRIRAYG